MVSADAEVQVLHLVVVVTRETVSNRLFSFIITQKGLMDGARPIACLGRGLRLAMLRAVDWECASLGGKPGAAARSKYSPADVFSIGETNFSLLRLFMNWVRH